MFSKGACADFSPKIIRKVVRDLQQLNQNPIEGIRLHVNESDIRDIQATIIGPEGTPYAYGQFRVQLVLPKEYPNAPPKGYFVTKIFHPNVSQSGEICVNTLKKDWTSDTSIRHVFLVIRCLMIEPNADSALNSEAGQMLQDNYSDYFKRAKTLTLVHAPMPKLRRTRLFAIDSPTQDVESPSKRNKRTTNDKMKALKRLYN